MRYVHQLRAEFRLVVERVHGEDADRGAVEIARPGVQRVDHVVFELAPAACRTTPARPNGASIGEIARELCAAGGIEHQIDAGAAGDRGDARRDILACWLMAWSAP